MWLSQSHNLAWRNRHHLWSRCLLRLLIPHSSRSETAETQVRSVVLGRHGTKMIVGGIPLPGRSMRYPCSFLFLHWGSLPVTDLPVHTIPVGNSRDTHAQRCSRRKLCQSDCGQESHSHSERPSRCRDTYGPASSWEKAARMLPGGDSFQVSPFLSHPADFRNSQ